MFRLRNRLKALSQLGLQAVANYAWHQFRLRIGWLRHLTPTDPPPAHPNQLILCNNLLPLPDLEAIKACLGKRGETDLLSEAEEILDGKMRLFGGPAVPLQLDPGSPLLHWTAYESRSSASNPEHPTDRIDIKFIWEPGRFGWAFVLARAFLLTRNEAYAECFWTRLEHFLDTNPVNLGPHWASAQEVALRLVAFVFASQVFLDAPSSTPSRRMLLANAIANHAKRIPPTLAYARAQHNNHLISEAVGLYTAGLALPAYPEAKKWRKQGWHWLNYALQTQIAPSGAYAQHSTNYHRLMLQAVLWANHLAQAQGQDWPEKTNALLAASTRWLLALCDPYTGQLPNLGPNDGALIFPLAPCPFEDYRPTLSAAGLAFLGENRFQSGPWDETAIWFGLDSEKTTDAQPAASSIGEPHCLHAQDGQSWAYLRMANISSRPGHADQLHLDLWWKGLNLAKDAGTYSYNAPPPWENALTHTAVHNTLTINGMDQMTRVGRFLYLDWAQARQIQPGTLEAVNDRLLVGVHDGYRRYGFRHQRSVEYQPYRWIITDQVISTRSQQPNAQTTIRIHWLLPDFPFELEIHPQLAVLRLSAPQGVVTLNITHPTTPLQPQLVRAGECLFGSLPFEPTWGWTAPTYGYKIPSLSFSVVLEAPAPLTVTSIWDLPSEE